MYFTYVLYSPKYNRFYIGQTANINNRLHYHNSGLVKSTKPYVSWDLVGFIEKPTRSDAAILERKLKNLNSTDLKKFVLKYFGKDFNLNVQS
jgi:putative endonuclease